MGRNNRRNKGKGGRGGQGGPKAPPKPTVKPVGLFVTSDLQVAIESCRKEVELIAKNCRAKNLRFRDREFDLQYDTFVCLNGYHRSALTFSAEKDVQRVTEIFDEPHFFPKGGAISSNSIAQGSLGDCYFLSALATVSCIPGLIEKICVARDEAVGVYGFIFYSDLGWKSVVIDDMLLTKAAKFEELGADSKVLYHHDKERYEAVARKGGTILLFAKAGSQDEMWVPLIEKAYAKHYGNFSHIEGGFANEAVEDLTGGVSLTFNTKDILDTDRFWTEELEKVNKDRLFGCSFQTLNTPDDEDSGEPPVVEGLFGSHAYAVLRAVECKGKKFVIVRNPWGKGEWTGRWSDGSKEWTQEWVEILPQLGHSFGDDGQFVMEYKDFLRCFERIQRTFLFDDSWVAASTWMKVPLGEKARVWNYGTISYTVEIPKKTKTIFSLSRLNTRFFDSIKEDAAISLEYAVVLKGEREPLATAGEWRPFRSRSVTLELELEPGAYYIYVKFDRETGDEQFDFEGTSESIRVNSRVVRNRVRSQAVVEDWSSSLKATFIPRALETVIAEDLEENWEDENADEDEEDGNEEEAKEEKIEAPVAKKPAVEEAAKSEENAGEEKADGEGDGQDGEAEKKEGEAVEDGEKKEDGEEGEENDDDENDDEDEHDWETFLKDEGHIIFIGLRVYTQTKEPVNVTSFLSCDGGKNCVCGSCKS